jgi:hypothetical protein
MGAAYSTDAFDDIVSQFTFRDFFFKFNSVGTAALLLIRSQLSLVITNDMKVLKQ